MKRSCGSGSCTVVTLRGKGPWKDTRAGHFRRVPNSVQPVHNWGQLRQRCPWRGRARCGGHRWRNCPQFCTDCTELRTVAGRDCPGRHHASERPLLDSNQRPAAGGLSLGAQAGWLHPPSCRTGPWWDGLDGSDQASNVFHGGNAGFGMSVRPLSSRTGGAISASRSRTT